jgi:thymidylate synthase
MSIAGDRYVLAENLSEGWLDAVRLLHDVPGGKVVHLIVRILDPQREVPEIRAAAQALVETNNASGRRDFPDIETTRNTIFPAAYARRTSGPKALADYYRARYTKELLLGFKENAGGTYFGRIVAYPRADGEQPADQLTNTVRKLRQELREAVGSKKSSRYEISVYNETHDTSPMGFPCLAHVSVHLHERRVHLQAIYRNESIIERGYGNFVGLAELQAYIARHARAGVGELVITAGHAELDGLKRPVTAMLKAFG